MPALFITGTGTDVGKTYVACGLIRALNAQGRSVQAFKPVLSGFERLEGSDAARLMEAAADADLDRMSPWRFKAPLAPPSAALAEGARIDPGELADACRRRIAEAGEALLLIEGAGGVMSPLAEATTNLDLAAELGVAALLVCGSYLGAVSHTLTAVLALESRAVHVPAIIVSESEGEAPPISEVTNALRLFAPSIPALVARRGGAWPADALARLIA